MPDLDARLTSLELAVTSLATVILGEGAGHPFHGNQHTGGGGGDKGPRVGSNEYKQLVAGARAGQPEAVAGLARMLGARQTSGGDVYDRALRASYKEEATAVAAAPETLDERRAAAEALSGSKDFEHPHPGFGPDVKDDGSTWGSPALKEYMREAGAHSGAAEFHRDYARHLETG